MHRGPKVHAVRDRASVLNAEKLRKREYTILRRERKEMTRNDIDVGKNARVEHQPMPTEATPTTAFCLST